MAGLLETLKAEHQTLGRIFEEMKTSGIGSGEAQGKLFEAKELLLEHLKREDEEFYPPLRKASESDGNLKWRLEMFARDMDEISESALKFFLKYADGGQHSEFAQEIGHLYGALTGRIKKEEEYLFLEYEKLEAGSLDA